ncbi:RtcB family protein [Thermoproteota archaeon]
MITKADLNKITDYLWEIPASCRQDMIVPARIYIKESMLDQLFSDRSIIQLTNIATLPGIQKYSVLMPDAHEGYGFPIGGVAAFDEETGVISPGGIGYDINCGVRLLKSCLFKEDILPYIKDLGHALFNQVPCGVGKGGKFTFRGKDMDKVLQHGAKRMVELGYGEPEDLEHIESGGELADAMPDLVSDHAKKRGIDQVGTMGAGNHFVEIDYIDMIYDEVEAARLGLKRNQISILIHTGSRGLGHQVATDYLREMVRTMPKYKLSPPDRELACAPFQSPEGRMYFSAMSAAANYAWANRQMITHEVRNAWNQVLGKNQGYLDLVYDVAHNIAKRETHPINNTEMKVVVHRKGATRAFPGQPVIIPGSMGTSSYLLSGLEQAMSESFGSSCHGAGRRMSRHQARKDVDAHQLMQQLNQKGIFVQSGSLRGLAEEAPQAYHDVDDVVDVIDNAGIAKKMARFRPLAVIKG